MTDILKFYLEKYEVIEKQTDDSKVDRNDKARERWELLRNNIGSVSDLVEKRDLKDNKTSHGIQYIRRISHVNDIEQAFYIPQKDIYLTLDACSIRMFDSNGRYKNFMACKDIGVAFARLGYSYSSDRFVAWTPNMAELAMLGPTFEVIEKVDPILIEGPMAEIFFNEDKNEFISSHCNKISIWQFRYANKHLIPRMTVNIDHKDKFSTIFTIERTQRKFQRIFLANDSSVTVIELSQGVVISNYKSLHERPITALTFFNPLKLLITGCRDGSIKVWSFADNEIKLNMVFVGHTSSVNSLAFFPGGCQATIASCGNDKTLRVWSLELDDEVECLDLEYSSRLIGSDITKSTFFTLGKNFVDIWRQNHISDDLMTLSSPLAGMELIEENSQKMLIRCRNNLVCFVNPCKSGHILTKTVVPKHMNLRQSNNKILSTVCLDGKDILLVLLHDNRILRYDTKTHPMSLVACSQHSSDDILLLLTAYKQEKEVEDRIVYNYLIVSGTNRGWIKVHDINNLEVVTFEIEAHADSAIVCMLADPSNSKFYTSGVDNSIKVWHIYPFAAEPFSKILSFFCGLLPTHLASINNYLFTVFHDADGAQYPAVVYNIHTRGRYDHSPTDDHIEAVNSVSACTRLKLFLSCSAGAENIIKIWTCKNVLLRQIEMHFPVHYAIFSSQKADIFAAIGHQVCHIDYRKYLPKIYIKKQILMHFEDLSEEEVPELKFDSDIFQKFEGEDRDKMQSIKSVFRYVNYTDILTKEELQELSIFTQIRQDNLGKLKAIEEDIRKIKIGEHEKPKKKYEKFLETPQKSDIFDLYFSQIVKYCKIPLPLEEDELEKYNSKLRSPVKYRKSEKEGFFPSHETMSKLTAPDNIKLGGYIPNSSILQSLWPPDFIAEKADTWKSPARSLFDLKIREMAKTLKMEAEDEEETQFFDWGSDEEPVNIVPSPIPTEAISEKLSDDLLSRFGSILEDKQSVPEEKYEELMEFKPTSPEKTIEIIKRPISTKITRNTLKLPEITRQPATMPDIRRVKFTSSADSRSILEEEQHIDLPTSKLSSTTASPIFMTQIPNQEPLFKEKVSHLPEFLDRFKSEIWFQKLCPPPYHEESCLQYLPSSLNSNSFTMHILQHLRADGDPDEQTGMVNAIKYLYSNETVERINLTHINSVLESKLNSLTELEVESKLLLFKAALYLMASLEGISDKVLVTICLGRFFDADSELKTFLRSILCHIGLEDNTGVIEAELESFKLFSIRSGPDRVPDLMNLIYNWLDKWYQSMVSFAVECREIISKEIHMIGSKHMKLSKNTLSCLENVKNIFHCHIMSPADLILLYPVDKNPKTILTYINCLNFFRFKKLKKTSKNTSMLVDAKPESTGPRKTIVSLPKLDPNKQCLVRLGESNADVLEASSKKDFLNLNMLYNKHAIADHSQHPSMQPFHHYQISVGGGFVPFLHLHLKPCLVNPFPSKEDYMEWEAVNSKPLFHRKFIPQLSLPPEPF